MFRRDNNNNDNGPFKHSRLNYEKTKKCLKSKEDFLNKKLLSMLKDKQLDMLNNGNVNNNFWLRTSGYFSDCSLNELRNDEQFIKNINNELKTYEYVCDSTHRYFDYDKDLIIKYDASLKTIPECLKYFDMDINEYRQLPKEIKNKCPIHSH